VPTAAEAATAVEAATHAMAPETSNMSDTHTVGEAASPKMGNIYAAVSETITSKMGGTYAAVHVTQATHAAAGVVVEAVGDIANPTPGGVGASVVSVATKYGGIAVIAEIICACRSTAVNWVVDGAGRASSECHVVSWEGILGGGRS
jgi:hypothetical protein